MEISFFSNNYQLDFKKKNGLILFNSKTPLSCCKSSDFFRSKQQLTLIIRNWKSEFIFNAFEALNYFFKRLKDWSLTYLISNYSESHYFTFSELCIEVLRAFPSFTLFDFAGRQRRASSSVGKSEAVEAAACCECLCANRRRVSISAARAGAAGARCRHQHSRRRGKCKRRLFGCDFSRAKDHATAAQGRPRVLQSVAAAQPDAQVQVADDRAECDGHCPLRPGPQNPTAETENCE